MVKNNPNNKNQHSSNVSEPKYLYKYFSLDEKNTHHIRNMFIYNKLYFPAPSEFNDPFDCRLKFLFNGTKQQWRQFFNRLIKEREPELNRSQRQVKLREMMKVRNTIDFSNNVLRTLKDDIGVLCLSEINDDILMWSHYSQGHTGFCLEFSYSPKEYFFGRALKVNYKLDYPLVNFFISTSEERFKEMIFTKARFWEYEKEWRIVEYDYGRGAYGFPKELLTGITFGCQMSDENKKKIKEWVQTNTFTPIFYQASIKYKKYGLDIEKVE